MFNWRMQQSGVFILVFTLLGSAFIMFGFLSYDKTNKLNQTRIHGIELARILSEMPYEQLVKNKHHNGLLAIAKYYIGNPRFAYVAVTDKYGSIQASATQPGQTVSHRNAPVDPSGWLSEITIEKESSDKRIIEFQAPILSANQLNGFVRIAFHEPSTLFSSHHIPVISAILLPFITIVGLFIYLLNKENRVLSNLGNVLSDTNKLNQVQVSASGELAEFIDKFNQYISGTKQHIEDVSNKHRELETSSKLISYQQAKIQSILHAVPEGMIVIDDTGNISFANDKMMALFGVDKNTLSDKSLIWCTDDKVKNYLHKIITNPLSNNNYEQVEFIPEGYADKKYVGRAFPLFSPRDTDQIHGTLVVFRDYTEESLAKNARGEFVAHVAHEIKNPLNVLAMYSESLLTEEGESHEHRIEAVNVILDEVERLSMLINNLLSITKIEMGSMDINRQRVKLKDLLEDVFATIKRTGSNKKLDFVIDVPGDLSSLYIDKDLMRIALNNLLSNAVKYSNHTGSIILSAEESDGYIHIKVADSGIGVSEEDQQFIFDKFYRSDSENARARTGHGLGLSLVKDIVNLHHGRIDINSTLGNGTEFIITIENNAALLERVS